MLGESKKSLKSKLLSKYFYGEKTNQTKKRDKNCHHKKRPDFFFFSQPSFTHICLDTNVCVLYMEEKKRQERKTDR